MRNNKNQTISTQSEMSNLVGMWIITLHGGDNIHMIYYVNGKADKDHYIVQLVSPLTGEPNIAILITIKQLIGSQHIIIPNRETLDAFMLRPIDYLPSYLASAIYFES